ncbi:MAG: FMN-binding protein [Clostridia bacterium]|nr:FMN-binding protein [Clostridia bacterium]
MKKYLGCILALTLICSAVAVLMALTNSITAPIIAKNQAAAANEALLVVMPDGGEFTELDLAEYALPASVTNAYSESGGGYVLQMNVTGYSSNMIIMCGVDKNGVVTGATCLSSSETLGYEKTYGDSMVGKNADEVAALDTIGGATKTTAAYKSAVADALNAAIILGGGSVDIRTPEQILNDNLSAALPAANGEFSEMFIIEDLGVDSMYIASNAAGYVFVIGENFVGTDMDGNVVSEVSDELKALATDAVAKVYASTMEDVDLSQYPDMPEAVTKAYVTASGNYVFEIQASGYGIKGDKYIRSGEYINVRVSATADGRIIATQTMFQKESEGFGDACAKPDFYTQFNGKTSETYKEIDAIGGATITTEGYVTAISRVFEAINILKGDA